MKKSLKITGIVIAAILVLLIVLPYAFRGKIKDIVLAEVFVFTIPFTTG